MKRTHPASSLLLASPPSATQARRLLPLKGGAGILLCRLGMKTCSFVAAMRLKHPEFAVPVILRDGPSALLRMRIPRTESSEGVARRKAQSYGIAISTETARAPLGAPHALKQREAR